MECIACGKETNILVFRSARAPEADCSIGAAFCEDHFCENVCETGRGYERAPLLRQWA